MTDNDSTNTNIVESVESPLNHATVSTDNQATEQPTDPIKDLASIHPLLPSTIDSIREGNSVRKACSQTGIDPSNFYKYLHKEPEIYQLYLRARADSSDVEIDNLLEINDLVTTGEIDSAAGRVVSDNLKWIASRKDRARWGDQAPKTAESATNIQINLQSDQMSAALIDSILTAKSGHK